MIYYAVIWLSSDESQTRRRIMDDADARLFKIHYLLPIWSPVICGERSLEKEGGVASAATASVC